MFEGSRYKDRNSVESKKEASRIVYSDRVPVIVERKEDSDVPEIDKNKYLVPIDLTVGQFMYVIRKRMKMPPRRRCFYSSVTTKSPNSRTSCPRCTTCTKTRGRFLVRKVRRRERVRLTRSGPLRCAIYRAYTTQPPFCPFALFALFALGFDLFFESLGLTSRSGKTRRGDRAASRSLQIKTSVSPFSDVCGGGIEASDPIGWSVGWSDRMFVDMDGWMDGSTDRLPCFDLPLRNKTL